MPFVKKNKGVLLDPYQQWVLDTWVSPLLQNYLGVITRGHVDPQGQLDVITMYANKLGVRYPEFSDHDVYNMCDVEINGVIEHTYGWRRTWGEELHRGIRINPPLAAVVPYDYVLDGVNKKGQLIQASSHIKALTVDPKKKPCPIDASAKLFALDDVKLTRPMMIDIEFVADIFKRAKLNGAPIRNVIVEHNNGCVHSDLENQSSAAPPG